LYRPEDLGLRSFSAAKAVDDDVVRTVAAAVRRHGCEEHRPVAASDLQVELDVGHSTLTRAVNLLEQAERVTVSGKGELQYTDPDVPPEAAAEQAVEVAESLERRDRSRIEMMRGYAETTGCRRQFLLGYFGEELDQPCGRCDTCASGSATQAAHELADAEREDAASDAERHRQGDRVVHREWGGGVVMHRESDRVTVLFEQVGYKTLAHELLDADPGLLQPQ
jgi:ATP-dependent DNA helicase RecQ